MDDATLRLLRESVTREMQDSIDPIRVEQAAQNAALSELSQMVAELRVRLEATETPEETATAEGAEAVIEAIEDEDEGALETALETASEEEVEQAVEILEEVEDVTNEIQEESAEAVADEIAPVSTHWLHRSPFRRNEE